MSIQNQSSRPPASSSRTCVSRIARKPVGEQAAGAARADDHVVECAEVLQVRFPGGIVMSGMERQEARGSARGGAGSRTSTRAARRATTPRSPRSPERARLAACLAALEGFDIRRVRIPVADRLLDQRVQRRRAARRGASCESAASAREVRGVLRAAAPASIGAHAYSLDDIEHGLLRGNVAKQGRSRPPMQRGDPRLEYMPIVFDERMHFALHSACRSSPPLRVFDGGKLDRQLEEASGRLRAAQRARRERRGAVIVPAAAVPLVRRGFRRRRAASWNSSSRGSTTKRRSR